MHAKRTKRAGSVAAAVAGALLLLVAALAFGRRQQRSALVLPPAGGGMRSHDRVWEGRVQEFARRLESENASERARALEELEGAVQSSTAPYALDVRGATVLLPGLRRLARDEHPYRRRGAAHLLGLIPASDDDSLAALCNVLLIGTGRVDPPFEEAVARSLIAACGGPEAVCPRLQQLLRSENARTRRRVARVFGKLHGALRERTERQPDGRYLRPAAYRIVLRGLWEAIPALARALSDPDSATRAAAAESLEDLAYASQNAPWEQAIPALTAPLKSPLAADRLRAARVLAVSEGRLTGALPAARQALFDPDATVRAYVTILLWHIVWDAGDMVTNAFADDLRAPDPAVRRRAARELAAAALPVVWDQGFWGEEPPTPRMQLPNNARHGVWDDESQRRNSPEAVGERHGRLLDALVAAAHADDDPVLRQRVARILIRIARAVLLMDSHVMAFSAVEHDKPAVHAALSNVAALLSAANPAASRELNEWAAKVHRGAQQRF